MGEGGGGGEGSIGLMRIAEVAVPDVGFLPKNLSRGCFCMTFKPSTILYTADHASTNVPMSNQREGFCKNY